MNSSTWFNSVKNLFSSWAVSPTFHLSIIETSFQLLEEEKKRIQNILHYLIIIGNNCLEHFSSHLLVQGNLTSFCVNNESFKLNSTDCLSNHEIILNCKTFSDFLHLISFFIMKQPCEKINSQKLKKHHFRMQLFHEFQSKIFQIFILFIDSEKCLIKGQKSWTKNI